MSHADSTLTTTVTVDGQFFVSFDFFETLLERASLYAEEAAGLVLCIEDTVFDLDGIAGSCSDDLLLVKKRLHGLIAGLEAVHRKIQDLPGELRDGRHAAE